MRCVGISTCVDQAPMVLLLDGRGNEMACDMGPPKCGCALLEDNRINSSN